MKTHTQNLSFKLSTASLITLTLPNAFASDLTLKINLPQLNVAEYHRPYVASWIERADQSFVANLNIWYDLKKKDNGGTKWVKDLRQWWRKVGRDINLPIDGISGATRSPGEHTLNFTGDKNPFNKLNAGDYVVVIEVVREAGGRELVKMPIQWKTNLTQTFSAQGSAEIGKTFVQFK